ncbi:hypothetical protein [Nocardia aurantia]|uniref:Uncharacterized protein n=1 Tax=Nocardia aurantia TaxID=2585199 RepID=A0A7K0DZ81_9NOCA|nr:hypothetical protein [Nocardia aurantia]MQY30991.1 hypothetical protein [Nocardia aurantia]
MATGVGLRIAEDVSVAAIVTSVGSPGAGTPEPHYVLRESVLHMADDGDTELGGQPLPGHSHSIRNFVSAIGDPAGVSVDSGPAYRPEDLLATALFCLINLAAEHLVGPAEFYAAYPPNWPEEDVQSVRDALDYLGLRAVVLVSEGDLVVVPGASGYAVAQAAAQAALSAVLSTPAGTTPPDPTHSETSLQVTDVLPALDEPRVAQAYSAAMPLAEPIGPDDATVAAENVSPPAGPATTATRVPRRPRRIAMLVAAAAFLGLLLGAVVVGVAWRANISPSAGNARTAPTPTTVAAPPAPAPTTTESGPTSVEPADTQETPETTEATPEPTTADTPPPPTTTPTPTSPPRSTTRTPRGSTTRTPTRPYPYPYPYGDPYGPSPDIPRLPTLQIPQ